MMVMAKYIRATGQSRGSAALSPIHNGRVGTEIRISMPRWATSSISPPK